MQSNPTSSPPPSTTTSSTSTVETVQGTNVFHLCGYKFLRGIGAGRFVRSGTFAVGGYLWSLRFFPGGDGGAAADGRGTTTTHDDDCCFHAELMTKGAEARACFTIGLVNQADGSTRWEPTTPLFRLTTAGAGHGSPSASIAVKRSKVEDFAVLRGDRVSVVCVVGVIKNPRVSPAETIVSRVEVPPPDMPECLGRLLEEGVGTDVNINVGDETFAAHKIMLAMRSPVFKAQLYGPMKEKTEQDLTVDDMQPAVFRALLRFIYTDSLPAIIGGQYEDDRREMVCHLLVAADRYGMERLKTICQGILCKALAVHTVADMLALADQHHCSMLKDACMEFIFSPNRLGDVVESHGYAKLRTTCPSVLLEILEKSSEFQKT
ncbi:unnamed protein product [Urochloa decumbens]|uniref:BTB domain-containing protein n=1 Tax=Urochloa decumbens TaxID=240449 RepID=A0ABC9BW79_9POAL